MNILLATYNFFPFNWGGSEIYVEGLAQHLQAKGCNVKLITAVPAQAMDQYGLYWSGKTLKICYYEQAGIGVYGVHHPMGTAEIYQKYKHSWQEDWEFFFSWLEKTKAWVPDLFHLHGFTAIIGLSLLKAIRNIFPSTTIRATYHTPISCPKGTLLRWEQEECNISANVADCGACSLQAKTQWPKWLVQGLIPFMPKQDKPALPTALRWKALTQMAISAFEELTQLVDHWWVFSNQIQKVLQAQGVPAKKIVMGRHGIAQVFVSHAPLMTRPTTPLIFGFVGRFKAIKGLSVLLEAWLQIPESPSRQLWLIGDVEDADESISSLLQQLQLRNDVRLFKAQQPATLAQLYAQMHALIVPSTWVEIGPLVVHEALACGTNVIGTDLGGIKELGAHYPYGAVRLFPKGDAKALAELVTHYSYTAVQCNVLTQAEHCSKVHNWYLGQN